MKESTRNFATGIVAIIALTGLAFLLLLFGDINSSIKTTYLIEIRTNQALGLRRGSPVTLVGVPVGEIESVSVRLENPVANPRPVLLIARINGAIDLPEGAQASVTNSLIGGTARLDLSIPPGYVTGSATLARDGNAVIDAQFEALEARMTRIITEKLEGFDSASRAVTTLARDVQKLAAEAQKWLGDEQLLADAKSAVWKAQNLIEQAAATMMALTEAAKGIQSDSHTLTVSLQPVLDQISTTITQIETLTKTATDGTGTVGQLMNNPDLYNALVDSAARLKRALGEVELLMQKIRAEGLGVKF
ncbi:MAG: MCE family protein [Phycisphaerales bacterium]|nr:MCE family protein [Phycisphaerales bacterium]